MTEDALVKSVLAGDLVVVGEWRGCVAEMLKWSDSKSGRAREAGVVKHSVEFGAVQCSVTDNLPPGILPESYVAPFKRGDRVVVHLHGLAITKGTYSARGSLEPLKAGR